MKIVVLLRRGHIDLDKLAPRHPEHQFILVEDTAKLEKELADAEMLITSNTAYDRTAAIAVGASKLKWIQFTMTGIDPALRLGRFPSETIVTNCAGFSAPYVSEHAFALMLAIGRCLRQSDAAHAQHEWKRDIKSGVISLNGKTICIIGMGYIGQESARRARAFGMKVIAVSRSDKPIAEVSAIYPRERLPEAMAIADVILVATEATGETTDMIDEAAFAAMKPRAILVNIARGDIIDENALVATLRAGKLAGVGLDVLKQEPPPKESPLWSFPNVLITPHMAGGGGGTDKAAQVFDLIDDNISRYTEGRPLNRVVNWQAMKFD